MAFGEPREFGLSEEEIGVQTPESSEPLVTAADIETTYQSIFRKPEKDLLAEFSREEKQIIYERLHTLSSLAQFIGKDFRMPVELNELGAGWHWNFVENKVRVDPKDLLEKPMDYLRFVISHEGGHRRISRTEFIPVDEWRQLGFSTMMNVIEDPRDNNFVAASYPEFRKQMQLAYQEDIDFEQKAKGNAKDKLGFQPRYIQAAFEYIKQWFRESQGQEFAVDEKLPTEVRDMLAKTLPSAQDSWLRYPSREMANSNEYATTSDGRQITGEELISKFAQTSYEINRDEVWPEFKKLIEEDLKDEQMQQAMQDMQQPGEAGDGQGLPQELKDQLTEEQQKELEQAISDAIDRAKQKQQQTQENGQSESQPGGEQQPGEQQPGQSEAGQPGQGTPELGEPGKDGKPQPIDLDALSEGLKQKLKDYLDSLPPEKQKELAERAEAALREIQDEINEELAGKMSDNPERKAEREQAAKDQQPGEEATESSDQGEPTDEQHPPTPPSADKQRLKDAIDQELTQFKNAYEEYRHEVLPIINSLEQDLRDIFVRRRAKTWESGFKSGKRLNIKRRMQEKAKGISPVESRAWQRREHLQEKDYAITILVDLSGSMRHGDKITETFKALVVLSEVLNRLSLNIEIIGFNDRIHEYQPYGTRITDELRAKMGGMLDEVDSTRATYNDDGWAVQEASARLTRQKAEEKFLIVLSDGLPEPSRAHSGREFDLQTVIDAIVAQGKQKLIGLGIGRGTKHVEQYYPNSLADIDTAEMAEKLADLIRDVIEGYNQY